MVRPLLLLAAALVGSGGARAQHDAEMDAGGPGVEVLGFGDVTYVETGRDEREGFEQGQVIGHVAAALSGQATVFVEVSATAVPEAARFDVERLLFRYAIADALKLSAGRYHTPISYWNTAFHHGLWLQTSVDRPAYTAFGGEYVPVHFVGLLAEGSVFGNGVEVRYAAGVGNGRSGDLSRAGGSGDANDERALLGSVAVRPEAVYGFEVGVGAYRDQIGRGAGAIDETILAAHLAFERESPEVLAEVAHIRHDGPQGRASNLAGYAQLAYRLSGGLAQVKPYARYERLDVPAAEPSAFDPSLDYEAAVGGLRYDFAPMAALKGEYRYERVGEGAAYAHGVYAQVSFVFGGPSL